MIDVPINEDLEAIGTRPLMTVMTDGPTHRIILADRPRDRADNSIIGSTMAEIFPGLTGRGLDELNSAFRNGERAIVRGRTPPLENAPADNFDFMCQPMRDGAGDISGLLVEVHPAAPYRPDPAALIGSVRATAIGTLASSTAHRISQPLTVISNYAAGIRRMLSQPARNDRMIERGLEAILEGVALSGEILVGLRALNRRGPAIRKRIDWEPMIEQAVIPMLSQHIPEGALRHDFSRISDRSIRADPLQIEQLLITLVANACAAVRGQDDPLIEILAVVRTDDLIQITVEDNGPGFAAGTSAAMFDALTSAEIRGAGFGLAIGRAIVEAHGGTIWAANRQGGGASIGFTLPT